MSVGLRSVKSWNATGDSSPVRIDEEGSTRGVGSGVTAASSRGIGGRGDFVSPSDMGMRGTSSIREDGRGDFERLDASACLVVDGDGRAAVTGGGVARG